MRPASAERQQAEELLRKHGWTEVKVDRATLANPSVIAMSTYCTLNFGNGRIEPKIKGSLDPDDVWYAFGWYGYYTFIFKQAEDATVFALRWM